MCSLIQFPESKEDIKQCKRKDRKKKPDVENRVQENNAQIYQEEEEPEQTFPAIGNNSGCKEHGKHRNNEKLTAGDRREYDSGKMAGAGDNRARERISNHTSQVGKMSASVDYNPLHQLRNKRSVRRRYEVFKRILNVISLRCRRHMRCVILCPDKIRQSGRGKNSESFLDFS